MNSILLGGFVALMATGLPIAIAMCLALAVVLYRVGTRGSVARKLSLLLVVEAVTLGSSSSVEFLLVSPTATIEAYSRWYEIMFLVHTLGDCAMLENEFDAGYAPRPDSRPLTRFETRGQRLGHEVWDLCFRKS